jgi:hypothetical protein
LKFIFNRILTSFYFTNEQQQLTDDIIEIREEYHSDNEENRGTYLQTNKHAHYHTYYHSQIARMLFALTKDCLYLFGFLDHNFFELNCFY